MNDGNFAAIVGRNFTSSDALYLDTVVDSENEHWAALTQENFTFFRIGCQGFVVHGDTVDLSEVVDNNNEDCGNLVLLSVIACVLKCN